MDIYESHSINKKEKELLLNYRGRDPSHTEIGIFSRKNVKLQKMKQLLFIILLIAMLEFFLILNKLSNKLL